MRQIELVNKDGGKQTFNEVHAANLLKKYKGIWDLPRGSKYKFKDGKFYGRTSNTADQESKE